MIRRADLALIGQGALLALLVLASPAQAQTDCAAQEDTQALREPVYRRVEAASRAIQEGNAAQAADKLATLAANVEGYERAVVLQTLGYAYVESGRDAQALDAFAEALAMEALPRTPQQQLRYNTAQLQIALGRTDVGIDTLRRYLAEACEAPPARAHMLLASALAEKERYRDSLVQVEEAFAKAEAPIETSWLRFKLGLHFETGTYDAAAEVLLVLIERAPLDVSAWKQLVGAYFEAGDRRRALAAQALSRRLGLLDEPKALRNLANLYRALDIPYKAGLVLREAMAQGRLPQSAETWEALANAWIAAREWQRADEALLAAAEAGGKAELLVRLGQVRVERGNWQAAVRAFSDALQRGVGTASRVRYQMGIAAWRAGDVDTARSALQAARDDPEQRQAAQQWLDFIERSVEAG